MGWRDTIKSAPASSGTWRDSIKPAEGSEPGMLNTLVTQGAAGATGGLDDEIAGFLSALGRVGGVDNLGGKIKDVGLADSGPTLDMDKLKAAYLKTRDGARTMKAEQSEAHPVASFVGQGAGMLANPLAAGEMGAAKLAALGAAQGLGDSTADNALGMAKDAALGGAIGGAAGAATPYLTKGLSAVGGAAAKGLGLAGEKIEQAALPFYGKATGATGKEAARFAPGTLEALRDNGIVKFGRSQSQIADAAQNALDAQGSKIGQIIDGISAKGATGSRDEVLAGLNAKLAELRGNPGEAETVRKLQGIVDDVAAGPETPSLRALEDTKRSFQSKVNWHDPDAQAAKATAADVYKRLSEKIVTRADPASASEFSSAKKLYGQLAPVADAANRRAMQAQQSPTGGLLDYVAYGAGGLPGVIAKKTIMPRVNSSLASSTDMLSKAVSASPEAFGHFAKPLMDAAARGPQAFAATHFLLQQNDPAYRERIKNLDDEGAGGTEKNLTSY